jgi:hypothetical protein
LVSFISAHPVSAAHVARELSHSATAGERLAEGGDRLFCADALIALVALRRYASR